VVYYPLILPRSLFWEDIFLDLFSLSLIYSHFTWRYASCHIVMGTVVELLGTILLECK
jgi:hypothetical protein